MSAPASFTCPRCGMTSHHPDDVRHQYCGNCHDFLAGAGNFAGTEPPPTQTPRSEAMSETAPASSLPDDATERIKQLRNEWEPRAQRAEEAQAAEPQYVHVGGQKLDEKHDGRREDCPRCQAAEPTERPLFWDARMSDAYNRGQREALLEAAKDLEKWISEPSPAPLLPPWRESEKMGVRMAIERLLARA